jgi:hypothetical protein
MKAVISCDDVFEVLTRGPFPSGGSEDAGVELHLRCCHACRQLAEALRPAVDLFHESLARDEEVALPAYLGRVERAVSRGLDLDDGGSCGSPPVAAADSAGRFWALLCGALIGVAASMWVWLGTDADRDSVMASVSRPAAAASEPAAGIPVMGEHGGAAFTSLGMSLSCFPAPVGVRPTPRVGEDVQTSARLAGSWLDQAECCTRCHVAGALPALSPAATHRITTSCATCHQQDHRAC